MSEKKVWCASNLSGETIIWSEGSQYRDKEAVLFVAMVTNPDTGARILSFCPVKPLTKDQGLCRDTMEVILNHGGYVDPYEPEPGISQAYLALVEDELRFDAFLANFCQCRDHDKERVRQMVEEQQRAKLIEDIEARERLSSLPAPPEEKLNGKSAVKRVDDNVICAAFRADQLFEDGFE